MMSRFLVPFQSPSRALGMGGDPFVELHRQMNRLFDDFFDTGTPQGQASLMAMPRLDVREGQDEICVNAELAGVRPEDVDVRVEGNVLTIRGEKKGETEQQQQDYHVMERSFGRFQRSVQLPYAPNPDEIRADFEHGVLTVHVPKQPQEAQSRRIEVHALGGPPQGQPASGSVAQGSPAQGQAAPGGSSMSHH